jgi:hypothetical protein
MFSVKGRTNELSAAGTESLVYEENSQHCQFNKMRGKMDFL